MIGKAAVVGGDLRAVYAARALAKRGVSCSLFALENAECGNCGGFPAGRCAAPYLLAEALQDADALLLPIPVSRDGEELWTPLSPARVGLEALGALIPRGCAVFGGRIPECLKGRGRFVDLAADGEFAARNALPTAENAAALAVLHYAGVLSGSRCLVLGYGRIGKALCRRLEALGAKTTVCARGAEARRQAALAGMKEISFDALPEEVGRTEIVFNTVPAPVFGEDAAAALPPHGLYVELASSPFGVGPAAREILKERFLPAPGLPGRYSPLYAGELIADAMLEGLASDSVKRKDHEK